MAHEIVVFENGTTSVRNTTHGEPMHSWVGPRDESREVYLEQTQIRERLAEGGESPLTVYDLGLGIGANALAAIDCQRALGAGARPLRIISFEDDLDGLRTALPELERFSTIAAHRMLLESLLEEGYIRDDSARFEWRLRVGDFLQDDLTGAPSPEAIFFDFYSPKATPELWGYQVFDKLRRACGAAPCWLATYSAATRVRSALLLAGFFVGRGQPTSAKHETTVATTRLEDLADPLGPEWFEKFNRSARSMPEDLPPSEWEAARLRVLAGPQSRSKSREPLT